MSARYKFHQTESGVAYQVEFDFERTTAARDEGIVRVIENSGAWFENALRVVGSLPPGWTGIGEDIREIVVKSPVGAPHSPNAWGALTQHAKKRGLLALTGVRRPMKSVQSHARMTDEYRRNAE